MSEEVLGVMEFRRYDDSAVKCNAIELSNEKNGITQAFAEHPGEKLVCVYVTDISHGIGQFVFLAKDNSVYPFSGDDHINAARAFSSGADYYKILNIGHNVVTSNILE